MRVGGGLRFRRWALLGTVVGLLAGVAGELGAVQARAAQAGAAQTGTAKPSAAVGVGARNESVGRFLREFERASEANDANAKAALYGEKVDRVLPEDRCDEGLCVPGCARVAEPGAADPAVSADGAVGGWDRAGPGGGANADRAEGGFVDGGWGKTGAGGAVAAGAAEVWGGVADCGGAGFQGVKMGGGSPT